MKTTYRIYKNSLTLCYLGAYVTSSCAISCKISYLFKRA